MRLYFFSLNTPPALSFTGRLRRDRNQNGAETGPDRVDIKVGGAAGDPEVPRKTKRAKERG